MNLEVKQLIKSIAYNKYLISCTSATQIVLSILYGVYLLAWVMRVVSLLVHGISFSLPLAFLWLTPCVALFHFSLNCILQQAELTGTMISWTTLNCFRNNQVRFLLLFPLSSASFLAIEWAYPFLLTLHFTVIPLAYTTAASLSLLCLICLIRTITSAFTTGVDIPSLSMSKSLISWSQGATTIQHPFSTPYTESFLSALITKIQNKQDSKASHPLPLEYALGFMDAKIFANCMRCYDSTSPEYQASCQAVRHILTPFLNHKYDLDIKTLSILQSIFSILPPSASPTSGKPPATFSGQTAVNHLFYKPTPHPFNHTPHISSTATPLFPPQAIVRSDTPALPVTQLLNIALPFSASLLPSLNKTLHHIPLPNNSQTPYLEPKTMYQEYKKLCSTISKNSRSDKNALSLFQRLYRNEHHSIREAFHALREKIPCASANAATLPRHLADPLDRSNTFARLIIRLMRYHTMFHNPLFASTALNHPGKSYSVRLYKRAPSRKNLYTGITLVARAVKLTHELYTFLQTASDNLMAMGIGSNIHNHIDTLRLSCEMLIENIFHGVTQMSVGSTMPRFYLLHGGYQGSTPDIVQNHPKFHRLFSTSYLTNSSKLEVITRHNAPIPTESQIAAHCNARRSSISAISHAFYIWHQLLTPRLPFWYHTTTSHAIPSIIASGKIDVRHSIYSGAFISTKIEHIYGVYTFAFSQETPLMANTFNKTSSSSQYLWHGCKAPIPLSPHLVAIGYPYSNRADFFRTLSSYGEVREDINRNLAYFRYHEQLVFLFTQDDLATIQKSICSEGANQAKVNSPYGESLTLPLPAHLMLHQWPYNDEASQDQDCYPLKQQLADNQRALSHLLDRNLLR